MRPSQPSSLLHYLAATYEEDRHRGEERRHSHERALLETRGEHPSSRARLGAALLNLVRRDDHSLTDHPCRLPDGSIGRVAVVQNSGEWQLVCRLA